MCQVLGLTLATKDQHKIIARDCLKQRHGARNSQSLSGEGLNGIMSELEGRVLMADDWKVSGNRLGADCEGP